ncbi:hypothetical protein AOL_s00006g300 [Orbilia oligospora ATCC 24927]|uniref:Uncharacterized protein n=1 Tax=Arthrobotrys oligospora (strain ATCC 24927 / CBS 115.81 / DSM 1491) TaxID=756982 RepID=G1X099_ARTOA|nr:hypothetical protein AOL_s00006g300 [Orbilia oligospora ATCC 24927]EGX53434.1 hypothetical protein AOL_s00006g300 [Orbilia oligospora ATCC 24927]
MDPQNFGEFSTLEERDWQPAIALPIDPKPRIQELRTMLNDPATCQEQIPNIKAAIEALESDEKPELVYQDG